MKQNYGRANAKAFKQLAKTVKAINALEGKYAAMSDAELQGQTQIFKDRYANGATLDELLPDAYAVCREAAKRTLGQRHFDVQLMGGIALHQGRICQMATGEGKTLTETLPAYLNGLTGNGVHIVTVNEYLAKRDMEWMGQVFKFLGLTVGVTLSRQPFEEKHSAYACDITYGTNSEFGFDYLRDNMATTREARVQRGLSFVIIDEVDSILIDEARTPLIISGRGEKPGSLYLKVDSFVKQLKPSTNVDLDGQVKDEYKCKVCGKVTLSDRPPFKCGNCGASEENLVLQKGVYYEDIAESLGRLDDDEDERKNRKTLIPNGDYVLDEKNRTVRLADLGVIKAQKRFEVENLSSPENTELNHFINNALQANFVMKKDVDYIKERGQIVIVDNFTGRKMYGRRFNNGLHQAIEAKEGVTIQPEDKTVATITLQNYFRLYRKMSGMTGTAKTEEKEFTTIYNVDVVVIPTNKPVKRIDHEDRFYATREGKLHAIVDKIIECHSKGQPVLVGTTSVEKSVELGERLKKSGIAASELVTLLNAQSKEEQEAVAVAKAGMPGAITIATNMAGRGTDILLGGGDPHPLARMQFIKELKENARKNQNKRVKQDFKDKNGQPIGEIELAYQMATDTDYDSPEALHYRARYNQIYEQYAKIFREGRQKVLQAGGLFVIGTERHDARRIDDQLRGRSGRQGDPGESMFFLSAEDDMIRVFGGDLLQRAMAFLKVDEDAPIQSRLISKMVENAQKRIEGMHFSSRKNILQYDDVNNQQRKIIYKERDRIIDNEDIHSDILAMVPDYARYALAQACDSNENVGDWNLEKVNNVLDGFFIHDEKETLVHNEDLASARHVCDLLSKRLTDYFNERLREAGDGAKYYCLLERDILLRTMDRLWMDHIDALDDLRQGVGLQAIGQHDPLSVYKKEAYDMFDTLNEQIKVQTLRRLMTFAVKPQAVAKAMEAAAAPKQPKAVPEPKEPPQEQPLDADAPLSNKDRWAEVRRQRDEQKALKRAQELTKKHK